MGKASSMRCALFGATTLVALGGIDAHIMAEVAAQSSVVRIYCTHPVDECTREMLGAHLGRSSTHALRYVKGGRNVDVMARLGVPEFDAFIYMGNPHG